MLSLVPLNLSKGKIGPKKPQLFVVSYPKLDKENFDWIQGIRRIFDEASFQIIQPGTRMVA